jgi:hypothetical protein
MEDNKEITLLETNEETKKQVLQMMQKHKEIDLLMNGMVLGILTTNNMVGIWRFRNDGNLERVDESGNPYIKKPESEKK